MSLPLEGFEVVEVSSLVAGPAMGSLLFWLGANVTKIEPPIFGDLSRKVSPWGFLNYNSGKKSLSLNLKSEKGQQILHRLISKKKPDIFIENMGPLVPRRLGFSYPALRKLNPSIIYCSIKGFSRNSAFKFRPAFDAVAQAMSGTMALTGEQGGEPVRIGNPSVDLGAAAYGTIEILSAALQREKSKKGKFIEVSLLDVSVYWNGYWLTYFGMTKKVPQRLGSGHPSFTPYGVFKSKDHKHVFVATLSDRHWENLSSLLDIKAHPNFELIKYRLSHRAKTDQIVQKAISRFTRAEVLKKLGLYVPCAPVRSIDDVYKDRELNGSGVITDIKNPFQLYGEDTVRVAPFPVNHELPPGNRKFKKRSPPSVPQIGEDNDNILKSIGYDQREIEQLRMSKVL